MNSIAATGGGGLPPLSVSHPDGGFAGVGRTGAVGRGAETLTHSEEIKSGLFEVSNLLSGEQQNVEALLRMVRDRLQSLKIVYARVGALSERVESAYLDLKDVGEEASRLFEQVEFDSGRQQVVEERLSILYDLEKKYGVADLDGLLALRDEIGNKLQQIESLDEHLEEKEKEVAEKWSVMLE